MAEPLKNSFGPAIPKQIAQMICRAYPRFPKDPFVADVLKGYEPLSLKARAEKISDALAKHLNLPYPKAIRILISSLGKPHASTEQFGMSPFLYFPHVLFVAKYGVDHFEASMNAQYELTKRFTAEFSIRTFLKRYPKETLRVLHRWAQDPDPHVRRLVSEGTRPRLPWAERLPDFQKNPTPVIALLEKLKDDPELYVRRSVANNLNDIGKDNPHVVYAVARSWLKNAPVERQWIVHHALRSAIKRGEKTALSIIGFGKAPQVKVLDTDISPKKVALGASVIFEATIKNTTPRSQKLLVDYCVHYIKAHGKVSKKVFKFSQYSLKPKETLSLSKKISFKDLTTRKHYPGVHKIELILNGISYTVGEFTVSTERALI